MRASCVLGVLFGALELAVSCSPPDYVFRDGPPARCDDGELNGRETDVDCGGGCKALCPTGSRCDSGFDCELGSCEGGICQAKHCTDDMIGGEETDFDCGGPECPKCGVNQRCITYADCKSNLCACKGDDCPSPGEKIAPDIPLTCLATGCDDGEMNGTETDKDCGGGTCTGCAFAKVCSTGGDCANGVCIKGRCSHPHCGDSQKQDDEDGIDCGNTCPNPCDDPAACADNEQNGSESDTDCGGETCPACKLGDKCRLNPDCETETCVDGFCVPDPCGEDPTKCMPDPGTGGRGGGAPDEPEGGDGSGGRIGEGGAPSVAGTLGGPNGGSPQGGTAGGSPSGGGGSGGSLGGAPSGGTSGSAGAGGSALSTCRGCARLSVPLENASHKANFVIKLNNLTSFATAKITYRVYKRAGSGGSVKGYIQHGPDNSDGQAFLQLFQRDATPLSAVIGWTEFTWDVAAQDTDFNKNTVARVGIQITATPDTMSWTNPTVMYLDSITMTGAGVSGWTFDNSGTVFTNPTTDTNPNVIWLNSGDNPVGGSSITWVGP